MVNARISTKRDLLSPPAQRQESPPKRPLSPAKYTGTCYLPAFLKVFLGASYLQSVECRWMGRTASREVEGISKPWRR